jgi:hypothetical protein
VLPCYAPPPPPSSSTRIASPERVSDQGSPVVFAHASPVVVPSHPRPHRSSRHEREQRISTPRRRAPTSVAGMSPIHEDAFHRRRSRTPSDLPPLLPGAEEIFDDADQRDDEDEEEDGEEDDGDGDEEEIATSVSVGTSLSFTSETDSELDFAVAGGPHVRPAGLRPRGALAAHHRLQQAYAAHAPPPPIQERHPHPYANAYPRAYDPFALPLPLPLPTPLHVQQEKQEAERAEHLQEGDLVYWHHLVRSGEIPGVVEDARARVARAEGESGGGRGRKARTCFDR